jgi:hypothetical protein
MLEAAHRSDWMHEARWGVFADYWVDNEASAEAFGHDGPTSAEAWEHLVADFDVEGLADQLAEVRAGYCIFPVGQNSGHYCAPNATYDRLTGIHPSKCSSRDLIADLYQALQSRGIELIAYITAGAPYYDEPAKAALGWVYAKYFYRYTMKVPDATVGEEGNPRLVDFQLKWQEILTEWGKRWGEGVRGWWIDGCYFPDMYDHFDPPNWHTFAAALRAGNPGRALCFNPAVFKDLPILSDEDDYTAGETKTDFPECQGRWIHGVQWHVLSYLALSFGGYKPAPDGGDRRRPRFETEWVVDYTRRSLAQGGVVTWDVPTVPSGLIEPRFMDTLRAVGEAVRGG